MDDRTKRHDVPVHDTLYCGTFGESPTNTLGEYQYKDDQYKSGYLDDLDSPGAEDTSEKDLQEAFKIKLSKRQETEEDDLDEPPTKPDVCIRRERSPQQQLKSGDVLDDGIPNLVVGVKTEEECTIPESAGTWDKTIGEDDMTPLTSLDGFQDISLQEFHSHQNTDNDPMNCHAFSQSWDDNQRSMPRCILNTTSSDGILPEIKEDDNTLPQTVVCCNYDDHYDEAVAPSDVLQQVNVAPTVQLLPSGSDRCHAQIIDGLKNPVEYGCHSNLNECANDAGTDKFNNCVGGVILENMKKDLILTDGEYRQHIEWSSIKTIGCGGQGMVRLCQDNTTEFKFCLKTIHKSHYRVAEVTTIMKLLGSPYFVQIYGLLYFNNDVHIIMEFVEGIHREGWSLDRWISHYHDIGIDLSLEDALYVIEDVLIALRILKSKGIIHNDIKAENILLSRTEESDIMKFKLCDFGLAYEYGTDDSHKTFGTVSHFSPEKARGMSLGYAVDSYAAMIVFLHMLTGSVPRYQLPYAPLLMKIGKDGPPLEEIPEDLPDIVRVFIEEGLHKDPEKRASIEEMHGWSIFELLESDDPEHISLLQWCAKKQKDNCCADSEEENDASLTDQNEEDSETSVMNTLKVDVFPQKGNSVHTDTADSHVAVEDLETSHSEPGKPNQDMPELDVVAPRIQSQQSQDIDDEKQPLQVESHSPTPCMWLRRGVSVSESDLHLERHKPHSASAWSLQNDDRETILNPSAEATHTAPLGEPMDGQDYSEKLTNPVQPEGHDESAAGLANSVANFNFLAAFRNTCTTTLNSLP